MDFIHQTKCAPHSESRRMRAPAGVSTAARERTRCAACWGTLSRAVVPRTCAHRTCETCAKTREVDARCGVCGRAYPPLGAPGAFRRDADADSDVRETYDGAEGTYDEEESARAVRALKDWFGYEESRAFARRAAEREATTNGEREALERTRDVVDDGMYEIELRPWREEEGKGMRRRFASAPKSVLVGALARYRDAEGGRKKRVAHIRDVRGRSHSFSESLETFFELARACGQPLVAYYE